MSKVPNQAWIHARVRINKDGCWIWQHAISKAGYGKTRKTASGTMFAHRASYELFVGPIPPGLQIDHLCRVRSCVNPEHLEPVTAQENVLRSPITVATRNKAKTHCPQNHPLVPGNLYIRKNGTRKCRTCNDAQAAASLRRRSLAGAR